MRQKINDHLICLKRDRFSVCNVVADSFRGFQHLRVWRFGIFDTLWAIALFAVMSAFFAGAILVPPTFTDISISEFNMYNIVAGKNSLESNTLMDGADSIAHSISETKELAVRVILKVLLLLFISILVLSFIFSFIRFYAWKPFFECSGLSTSSGKALSAKPRTVWKFFMLNFLWMLSGFVFILLNFAFNRGYTGLITIILAIVIMAYISHFVEISFFSEKNILLALTTGISLSVKLRSFVWVLIFAVLLAGMLSVSVWMVDLSVRLASVAVVLLLLLGMWKKSALFSLFFQPIPSNAK